MKTLKDFLQEKRSNPEKNISSDNIWEFLFKLENPNDYWMTFVYHPKLGINPINQYNTPTGIYSYHLKDYIDDIKNDKSFRSIPYQGSAPYIILFSLNTKKRILTNENYTSEMFAEDVKKLRKLYKKETKESVKFFDEYRETRQSDFRKRIKDLLSNMEINFTNTAEPKEKEIIQKIKSYLSRITDSNEAEEAIEQTKKLVNKFLKDKFKTEEVYLLFKLFNSYAAKFIEVETFLSEAKAIFASIRSQIFALSKEEKEFVDSAFSLYKKFLSMKRENNLGVSLRDFFDWKRIRNYIKNKILTSKEEEKKIYQDDLKRIYAHYLNERFFLERKNKKLEALKRYNLLALKKRPKYSDEHQVQSFSSLLKSVEKIKNQLQKLWFLTHNISVELSDIKKETAENIWNFILSGELNVAGVVDTKGIIHKNELKQSVFFNSVDLKMIRLFRNRENDDIQNSIESLKRKYDYVSLDKLFLANPKNVENIFLDPVHLKPVLEKVIPLAKEKIMAGKSWVHELYYGKYGKAKRIAERFRRVYGDWWDEQMKELKGKEK